MRIWRPLAAPINRQLTSTNSIRNWTDGASTHQAPSVHGSVRVGFVPALVFFGAFPTLRFVTICDERFTVNRSMTTGAGTGADGVVVVCVELTVIASTRIVVALTVIRKKPKFASLNCSSVIVLPWPSGSVCCPGVGFLPAEFVLSLERL